MEKQRRTEYKTGYKQIHACPPMLTTNLRSIGTKLYRLKVCMQLSLASSGLKAYLPSSISPALSALHSLHLMNINHHLCTLLQPQKLIDILDSAVQEWFQHFQLWEHTLGLGDKKAGPEDVHSMQKSCKWVLADLLLLYKEKYNSSLRRENITPAEYSYPTCRVPLKEKDFIKLPTSPPNVFNRKGNQVLLQGNCHEYLIPDCSLLSASLPHYSTVMLTSVRRDTEAPAMPVLEKGLITEAGNWENKSPYELLSNLCQKGFTIGFILEEFLWK